MTWSPREGGHVVRPTGLGVTSCVLHDEAGPFGTMAQILTIRA